MIVIKHLLHYIKDWRRDLGRLRKRDPNVLTFIYYGLLFDTVVNLWKPFSVKFLERLGGGSLEISLLNALPGLVAAAVLLPGAVFLSRRGKTKKMTAAFILISRAMLAVVAFVPMLPASVRPLLFVILIAVMNCPDALSQTSLQSFLGSVFTGPVRAQAITLRNKFGNAAVPLVTIVTGLAITYLPATEQQRMLLYQIFFVIAFLVGLLEVFVFNRFKETPPAYNAGQAAAVNINLTVLRSILRDKRFFAFIGPVLLFTFFWQAGWPLCSIWQVDNIKANELWFAIFSLASGAGAFATAGFWQKFIRKRGNAITLVFSAFMIAFNLLLFPLSPNVWVLALVSPFGGFATIGLNTALLNGVLESTPDENRLVYLAFYNTAVNISLFFAPIFAHLLMSATGIKYAFYIVILGRALSAGVITLMQHIRRKRLITA